MNVSRRRPYILLRGAGENNLRNVDVELPVGKLSCIAGISGSGKSSLVEKCLVAEAERRNQVLRGRSGMFPLPYHPKIESADLPFTIFVGQGVLHWSTRSTVGTATGILPLLRPLLSRLAEVRTHTGKVIPLPNPKRITEWLITHYPKAKITPMAQLGYRVLGSLGPRITKADALYPDILFCVTDTDVTPTIDKATSASKHLKKVARTQRDIYAFTGMNLEVNNPLLLEEAIMVAFDLANSSGRVHLLLEQDGQSQFFSLKGSLVHPDEPKLLFEPDETLLSFNSKLKRGGSCPTCKGLGEIQTIYPERLIFDRTAPVAYGGLAIPFQENTGRYKYFPTLAEEIAGFLVNHGKPQNTSWKQLDPHLKDLILDGSDQILQPISQSGEPKGKKKAFIGLRSRIKHALTGDSAASIVLADLGGQEVCPDCMGSRLRYEARRVFIDDLSLEQIYLFNLAELLQWLVSYEKQALEYTSKEYRRLIDGLRQCCRLGLGHLPLLRSTDSVSGGEGQRLRIARQLFSQTAGAAYVFDEPTRGLHTVDAIHLLSTVRGLLKEDTSVIVVDHNPAVIDGADHLVEIGPGAGSKGGTIIYSGKPDKRPISYRTDIKNNARSTDFTGEIEVKGISMRNVIEQTIRLPLGGITCVTGRSGSGKTTVVRNVLYPAIKNFIETGKNSGTTFKNINIRGVSVSDILHIPQMSLSDNPRSLVYTYLGLSDEVRTWFHQESRAFASGLTPAHFSSNAVGACPSCKGLGYTLSGSSQEVMTCEACLSSGLSARTLTAELRGQNFWDWLNTPVSSLVSDPSVPTIVCRASQLLTELGLGHICLGRRIPTLSGGESQRLRITQSLLDFEYRQTRAGNQHIIFLLDEPAAGLHRNDQEKLLQSLRRIVLNKQHTVILIEHSKFMVERADWIIEMGPGAASEGGQVIFLGHPSELQESGPEYSPTRQAMLGSILPLTMELQSNSEVESQDRYTDGEMPTPSSDLDCKDDTDTAFFLEENFLPSVMRPTYLLDEEGVSGSNHDLLALLGAALPLFRLFVNHSECDNSKFWRDSGELLHSARVVVESIPGCLIGWFPATSQGYSERLTWEDLRSSINGHLNAGIWGWFNGKTVQKKRPGKIDEGILVSDVRIVQDPNLPLDLSLQQALAFGEGWLSIIDPHTGAVKDLSLRAIQLNPLRIGLRWQEPQIFDRNSPLSSCDLCRGKGTVVSISESLLIESPDKQIGDNSFFSPLAHEALRSSMRKRMLPALRRLQKQGLIDLLQPYEQLSEEEKNAFLYGFPRKSFLSPGGNPTVLGDWYHWDGVVNCLKRDIYRTSDRSWSDRIKASMHDISCPECSGTGLGWEARTRSLNGVTFQDILKNWTIEQLLNWIKCALTDKNKEDQCNKLIFPLQQAVGMGLGHLSCGAKLGSLLPEDRLKARILACRENELAEATMYIRNSTIESITDLFDNSNDDKRGTGMQWVIDSTS